MHIYKYDENRAFVLGSTPISGEMKTFAEWKKESNEKSNEKDFVPSEEFVKNFKEQEVFFIKRQIAAAVKGEWMPECIIDKGTDIELTAEDEKEIIQAFLDKVKSNTKLHDSIQEEYYNMSIDCIEEFLKKKYSQATAYENTETTTSNQVNIRKKALIKTCLDVGKILGAIVCICILLIGISFLIGIGINIPSWFFTAFYIVLLLFIFLFTPIFYCGIQELYRYNFKKLSK